jgi:chemotaxis protein methyltransferase CheR
LRILLKSDSVAYQRRRGFLATPLPETTPLETDSFPHPFTIPSLSQSGNGKIETGDLVSPNAHSPLSINSQPILPTIPLGSYFPTQFRDLVQENSIGQTLPLKIISSPTINSQPETSTANHVTLDDAKKMFEQGNYAQAIQQLEQLIEQQPNNSEVYYLISQAHANVGDYAQATYFCEKVLQLDSLLIKPYCLLAQIAELQGNIIQAKELLKKIIYLDSNYISAYLDLGSLCEQEGDFNRSKKMYSTAIELLEALSSDLTIDYRGEVTVGELHTQVKATLCRLP